MYDLARNIADLRIKKMYTQKGLADALGVSKGTITSYESGVRVPPIDKLEEIAKLFNIKITDFFVENINDINFSKESSTNSRIPIVSHASAGMGKDNFEGDEILDYLELPNKIGKKVDFGTYVVGDSMSPKILDGDIVFIKKDDILDDGDIGLFKLNDKIFIKKFKYNPFTQETFLVPLNKEYSIIPIKKTDDFSIIGKVICKIDYDF